MATIKITLDTRSPYKDGRCPIVFRLTSNQKSTSISSGIKLLPKEWDASKCKVNKTHSTFRNINIHLRNKLVELEESLLRYASVADTLTVGELKELILKGDEKDRVNFGEFASKEIKALKDQERYGNAQSYETAVNRFIKYAGKGLTLDKIDYALVAGFDIQLIKEGLSRNSVAVYMREIRALLNKAIHKNLMKRETYPFTSYKIKTEKTVNRAITKQDIQLIRDLELMEGSKLWNSRNVFLLIYQLIGISFIDLVLLKASSVQGERVVYRRRKTGKIYSIKLTAEAKRILEYYRKEDSKYLLPLGLDEIPKSKEREEIALRLRTINKYLERVGKLCDLPIKLTTYVARYSWANVAKSLGFPKDQIAEALGHEYGNRITGIYLDNYGSEVIDEMNKKVSEF